MRPCVGGMYHSDRHCKAEGNAGMADVISKMLGKDADGSQVIFLSAFMGTAVFTLMDTVQNTDTVVPL